MITILNNTISPSFLISTNNKNILVNASKGALKNLKVQVDAVIITCLDEFHTYDLKEIANYKRKDIIPCYALNERDFNLKRGFKDFEKHLQFEKVLPNKKIFNVVDWVILKRGDKDVIGLLYEDTVILPSFSKFNKAVIRKINKANTILLSAKYLTEKEEKGDYSSIERIIKQLEDIKDCKVGFIGLTKQLKERFSKSHLGVKKIDFSKILEVKSFLYYSKGVFMNKLFNPEVKFDFVVSLQKTAEEEGNFFISGYASTPTVDRQSEMITDVALQKAASDLLKIPNSTVYLNHNYDKPIGRIVESKYTAGGIRIKVLITKTEPKLREQIKEGLWTSFSIGGIVHAAEESKDASGNEILKITDIELVEVSLVGIPANAEANLVQVIAKSLRVTDKTKVFIPDIKALREKYKVTKKISTYDKIDLFLDTASHNQKVLTASYSYFKLALISKAITTKITELGYECTQIINIDGYGQLCRPEYMNLSTARDKKEELLVNGLIFLKKDKDKLVIKITPGWYSFSIEVISNGKTEGLNKSFQDAYIEWTKENNFFKGEKITAEGKFLDVTNLTFDDLKIVDDKKKAIKVGALEFFKKKTIYKENNLPFKRGLILAGEPGTGKTLTGKILLANTDSTFIWITASDLLTQWGKIDIEALNRYLEMAKELSPSILFAEDVDDYLSTSGAVDALKTQMDGLDSMDGVVTMLCTNYPDRIPKSLIDRPSRFDDVIMFGLPNERLRYEILEAHTKKVEIQDKESVLKQIAHESEGLTGAHLKEIAIYSLLLAADEDRKTVELKDFVVALTKVKKTRELIQSMQEKKKFVSEVRTKSIFSYIDLKARGDGQGQGNERQGDGGAKYCVCPECGYFEEHVKGTPCNEKSCPECKVKLIGSDTKPEEKQAEDIMLKSVVPYQDLTLVDKELAWDATAAEDRVRKWASSDGSGDKDKVDWEKYQKAFTWFDIKDAENFGAYKLQVADIVDESLKAVPKAIYATAAALNGARDGVDISEDERKAVYNHIKKYYDKLDEEAPELKSLEALELELKELEAKEKEEEEAKKKATAEIDIKTYMKEVDEKLVYLQEAIEEIKEFLFTEEVPELEPEAAPEQKLEEAPEANKTVVPTADAEPAQRKGIVQDNDEDKKATELLEKIEGKSLKEIMEDETIWDNLDEDVKKEMKSLYFRGMPKIADR